MNALLFPAPVLGVLLVVRESSYTCTDLLRDPKIGFEGRWADMLASAGK